MLDVRFSGECGVHIAAGLGRLEMLKVIIIIYISIVNISLIIVVMLRC